MMNRKPWSDNFGWLDLNLGDVKPSDIERQRVTASALIDRLYGPSSVPGVILADEVGMGKTFVALAVAASVFRNYGKESRVVVLAPGNNMKEVWNERWNTLVEKNSRLSTQRSFSLPIGRTVKTLGKLEPGISFGSYEEMKGTTAGQVREAFDQAIKGMNRPRGENREKLFKALFDADIEPIELGAKIPKSNLSSFWRDNYDPEVPDEWIHPYRAYKSLQRLILSTRRPRGPGADIVIFDEAHRLGGELRHAFLSQVIASKADRIMFVSATPFSLDIDELLDRIEDMYLTTGQDGEHEIRELEESLNKFRQVVGSGDILDPSLKSHIQSRLRRYMVRNTWSEKWDDGTKRRELKDEKVSLEMPDDRQAFATFALEKTFVKMQAEDTRTFISTHRETLCSSYSAIRHTNDEYGYFDDVVALLPPKSTGRESPKLEHALEVVERVVHENPIEPEKIVVFCDRNETIRTMRRLLSKKFAKEQQTAAKRWDSIRESLQRRGWKGDFSKARLACYIYPDIAASEMEEHLTRLEGKLAQGRPKPEYWEETWGPRRHIDWVGAIWGESGDGDKLSEHVQFAFNLPGPPYVLLCSKKGGESIDLHLWCRKIMHYDLDWSPSVMEQRIGRIDRINSLAARRSQPIEIYLLNVAGTYEERILRVVKERMKMTRVLLGAGEWIRDSYEPIEKFGDELESYRLNFAPKIPEEPFHQVSRALTSIVSFVKDKISND